MKLNRYCWLLLLIIFISCKKLGTKESDRKNAISFYQNSNFDSAALYLKEIQVMNPEDKEINYYLGDSYYHMGELGKAALYLSKARSNGLNNSEVNFKLGLIGVKSGNCFLSPFFEAIEQDSTFQKAWYHAAYCLANEGQYIKAYNFISKSIELKNDDHLSYILRSRILYQLEDLNAALNDIDRAIDLKDSAYSFYQKAVILDEMNSFQESLLNSQKALSLDSAYLDAIYYKAMNLINLNRFAEGCLEIAKIKKLDPDWKINWDLEDFDKFCR